MLPDITEVRAPTKKATVVQAYPKTGSTTQNIKTARMAITIPIYWYSAAKNAAAPFSIYEAISNNSYEC